MEYPDDISVEHPLSEVTLLEEWALALSVATAAAMIGNHVVMRDRSLDATSAWRDGGMAAVEQKARDGASATSGVKMAVTPPPEPAEGELSRAQVDHAMEMVALVRQPLASIFCQKPEGVHGLAVKWRRILQAIDPARDTVGQGQPKQKCEKVAAQLEAVGARVFQRGQDAGPLSVFRHAHQTFGDARKHWCVDRSSPEKAREYQQDMTSK